MKKLLLRTSFADKARRAIRLSLCLAGIAVIAVPLINPLPVEAAQAKNDAKKPGKAKHKASKKVAIKKAAIKPGMKAGITKNKAGKRTRTANKAMKAGKASIAKMPVKKPVKKPSTQAAKKSSRGATPPPRPAIQATKPIKSIPTAAPATTYRPLPSVPTTSTSLPPARPAPAIPPPITSRPLPLVPDPKTAPEAPPANREQPPNEAKTACQRNGEIYLLTDCKAPIPPKEN